MAGRQIWFNDLDWGRGEGKDRNHQVAGARCRQPGGHNSIAGGVLAAAAPLQVVGRISSSPPCYGRFWPPLHQGAQGGGGGSIRSRGPWCRHQWSWTLCCCARGLTAIDRETLRPDIGLPQTDLAMAASCKRRPPQWLCSPHTWFNFFWYSWLFQLKSFSFSKSCF
jgi:hypothetical protein